MKSITDFVNEANKPKLLSLEDAFMYIKDKLGAACRYEKVAYSYEISPGYGNYAERTFIIEDDPRSNKGPVLYFDRWHSGPNAFTMDKSIQTNELYFTRRSMGDDVQYWRLTKEVIDKCLAACK